MRRIMFICSSGVNSIFSNKYAKDTEDSFFFLQHFIKKILSNIVFLNNVNLFFKNYKISFIIQINFSSFLQKIIAATEMIFA